MTSVEIYQPFFSPDECAALSPCAIPFDASWNKGSFDREYALFKALYVKGFSTAVYWGLLSAKFERKSPVSLEVFKNFVLKSAEDGYDCIFINPMIGNEALFLNVWEQGNVVHPGFSKISEELNRYATRVNLASQPMSSGVFAFCNFFIGNSRFWDSYFKFVDEIISYLGALKPDGSTLIDMPSGYSRNPHVSMRPFVIERLFSSFILCNPHIRVKSFVFNDNVYYKKFGVLLGEKIRYLSQLKADGLSGRKEAMDVWARERKMILQSTIWLAISLLDDLPESFV